MHTSSAKFSRKTRILFPIIITAIAGLIAPASVALVGFLMFGNLIRECGVLNSLSETAQKVLANLVTILPRYYDSSAHAGRRFRFISDASNNRSWYLVAFIFDTAGGVLIRQIYELIPQAGQEDKSDDRCGRYFCLPDVRTRHSQDGA